MTKFCPRCKTDKLKTEYYRSKQKRDGLRGWCKSCDNEVNHSNMKKPSYKKKTADAALRRLYGITSEERGQIASAQNYCCATCGVHESKLTKGLFVDHCHTTGQVRGLLCSLCNSALGKVYDNIGTLEKMIDYLKNRPNS